MSMVHLKTRRQQIESNKKAKEDIKIKWVIAGKEIEVLQPKEPPGCFETTKHAGIFFDGREQLSPGRLGNRVGFVREDHHYQVIHWMFNFSHPEQTRKTGKFILIVDGWEAESGTPVNRFFRWMYTRVFLSGFGTLLLSSIGIASVTASSNAILNGILSRIFLVFIPIALYYLYAGFVGMVKHHLRMKIDEIGDPWWPLDEVFADNDDSNEDNDDGDDPVLSINDAHSGHVEVPMGIQPPRQRNVSSRQTTSSVPTTSLRLEQDSASTSNLISLA